MVAGPSATAKQQRLLGYRKEAKWGLLGSDNVPSADNAGFKGHCRLLSEGFRVTAVCTLWGDLQSFAVLSTAIHTAVNHIGQLLWLWFRLACWKFRQVQGSSLMDSQ